MSKKKVSVIIPVYNKARYIKECVLSVINQCIAGVEIICIDDSSTDESKQLISNLSEKHHEIKILINSTNQGPGRCRNQGIHLAEGEYIVFLDADDKLADRGVAELLHFADSMQSEKADMIKGIIMECSTDTSRNYQELLPFPFEGIVDPRLEAYFWTPWYHQSYIYRTSFLRKYRILYPDLFEGEDPVFLALALSKANKILAKRIGLYLLRRGHEPAYRNTIRHLHDCIDHIRLVKNIQAAWNSDAWHCSYRHHCLRTYPQHFATIFGSSEIDSAVQEQLFSSLLEAIHEPPDTGAD